MREIASRIARRDDDGMVEEARYFSVPAYSQVFWKPVLASRSCSANMSAATARGLGVAAQQQRGIEDQLHVERGSLPVLERLSLQRLVLARLPLEVRDHAAGNLLRLVEPADRQRRLGLVGIDAQALIARDLPGEPRYRDEHVIAFLERLRVAQRDGLVQQIPQAQAVVDGVADEDGIFAGPERGQQVAGRRLARGRERLALGVGQRDQAAAQVNAGERVLDAQLIGDVAAGLLGAAEPVVGGAVIGSFELILGPHDRVDGPRGARRLEAELVGNLLAVLHRQQRRQGRDAAAGHLLQGVQRADLQLERAIARVHAQRLRRLRRRFGEAAQTLDGGARPEALQRVNRLLPRHGFPGITQQLRDRVLDPGRPAARQRIEHIALRLRHGALRLRPLKLPHLSPATPAAGWSTPASPASDRPPAPASSAA